MRIFKVLLAATVLLLLGCVSPAYIPTPVTTPSPAELVCNPNADRNLTQQGVLYITDTVGFETYRGRRACHIHQEFIFESGNSTSIDTWIDENQTTCQVIDSPQGQVENCAWS